MSWVVKIGLFAIMAYFAVAALVYVFQRSLLYLPPGPNPPSPEELREIEIRTDDGLALRHWYRPPAPGAAVVVMFHGNASSISECAPLLLLLLEDGQGLFLAEYRGYGGNPGRPTQEKLIEDGNGVLRWLAEQGVERQRIVLYGHSLGSGVVTQLAAQAPVAGVVLEAPFSSVTDVAAAHYGILPVRRLIKDRWDSHAVIGRVRVPILILHGERDRVIPIRFGRKLFAAAREPKLFVAVASAGHDDILADPDAVSEIRAFLSDFGSRGRAVAGRNRSLP